MINLRSFFHLWDHYPLTWYRALPFFCCLVLACPTYLLFFLHSILPRQNTLDTACLYIVVHCLYYGERFGHSLPVHSAFFWISHLPHTIPTSELLVFCSPTILLYLPTFPTTYLLPLFSLFFIYRYIVCWVIFIHSFILMVMCCCSTIHLTFHCSFHSFCSCLFVLEILLDVLFSFTIPVLLFYSPFYPLLPASLLVPCSCCFPIPFCSPTPHTCLAF